MGTMQIDHNRKMTAAERSAVRNALVRALAALDAAEGDGSPPDGLAFYFTDERGCNAAEIGLPFAEAVECAEHEVSVSTDRARFDGYLTGDEHSIGWGINIPVMCVQAVEDEDGSGVVTDLVLAEVRDG